MNTFPELIRIVQRANEVEKKILNDIWFIDISKLNKYELEHFKKLFNSIHIGSCWYYNLKYYGVDKYLDLKGSDKITFHDFISKNFEINFEQFFGNFEFYKNKYKPIEF